MMITVWCVCVGSKYDMQRVFALKRMVERNLPLPHEFKCITDSDLPGWWAKIDLHKRAKLGKNIYLDLDVVVVGDLTRLVEYSDSWLAMPLNWAKSGHGGFQSSVMCWSGEAGIIRRGFNPDNIGQVEGPENCRNCGTYTEGARSFWGDQEWLSWKYANMIDEIEPGLVVSYKYHCQSGPPENARVVCFHGKPDYWEVNHKWIDQALS